MHGNKHRITNLQKKKEKKTALGVIFVYFQVST